MLLPRSAKTRLIAASVALSMLATALVLGLLYWSAFAAIEGETRQVVNAELAGLSDDYRRLGALGVGRAINRRLAGADARDAVYLLTDRRGRRVAGNLAAWPPTVEPGSGWVELELFRTDRERTVMVSAASLKLGSGARLLVGRDSVGRARFDKALARAVVVALLAALALSAATGWLLSRLVFTRVADISRTAQEIVSGDLDRRVPLRGGGDEFDRLSATLNDMLDRIAHLIGNLRATTDSLAHDLRSPLTRLQAQIERLTDPATPEAARTEAARRANEEADHLIKVFTTLTEISRAEAGIGHAEFAAIDLPSVVSDVAELYEPVAAERGVGLKTDLEATRLRGYAPLLSQAVSNLLENALRYAPAGSAVTVRSGMRGGAVVLSVADQGPGVPPEHRDRVLDRFATLDPSRGERGAGLGLALVAAVARMHGGDVALLDNAPGLRVEMTIPVEPAAA
ncbi:MAG: ATP-binding protein [Pseudomonadota bacterium]